MRSITAVCHRVVISILLATATCGVWFVERIQTRAESEPLRSLFRPHDRARAVDVMMTVRVNHQLEYLFGGSGDQPLDADGLLGLVDLHTPSLRFAL